MSVTNLINCCLLQNLGFALDADLTLALKCRDCRLAFSVETQSYTSLHFEVENTNLAELRILKEKK